MNGRYNLWLGLAVQAAIGPVSARLIAIESRLTDMDRTIAMLYNQTAGSGH
ncbi:hypothetical protein K435DRAFT_870334 [Dendrothele bispora CBS 962.96]|uniref:Uncharacterized protein n=1 Tax=Dendrothele bispora (strain CBS 962.96) TaxID=1314807 RepID=A0A4S8L6S7_DENBC|nr:hypothetical protein K435DRAFT_870334 [Dendrothele bispora CBS 962.96]